MAVCVCASGSLPMLSGMLWLQACGRTSGGGGALLGASLSAVAVGLTSVFTVFCIRRPRHVLWSGWAVEVSARACWGRGGMPQMRGRLVGPDSPAPPLGTHVRWVRLAPDLLSWGLQLPWRPHAPGHAGSRAPASPNCGHRAAHLPLAHPCALARGPSHASFFRQLNTPSASPLWHGRSCDLLARPAGSP